MTYKNYKLDSKALFRGNSKTKQVGVYGSKKFPGPQNSGPGSVGQRNIFDLTKHIEEVVLEYGGTVLGDSDWTYDSVNNYVYNTTDNVGIGTATPQTLINTFFTDPQGVTFEYREGNADVDHLAPGLYPAGWSHKTVDVLGDYFVEAFFSEDIGGNTILPYYNWNFQQLSSGNFHQITRTEDSDRHQIKVGNTTGTVTKEHSSFDVSINAVGGAGGLVVGETQVLMNSLSNVSFDNSQVSLVPGDSFMFTESPAGGDNFRGKVSLGDGNQAHIYPVTGAQISAQRPSDSAYTALSVVTDLGTGSPGIQINGSIPPDYLDDAAAGVGGVVLGGVYRTGSILKIRVS